MCCSYELIIVFLFVLYFLSKLMRNKYISILFYSISFGSNLPNTDPYWKARKTELDALHFFLFKEYQIMPAYFDTSSCAEHHWKPLHQLLIKYQANIKKWMRKRFRRYFIVMLDISTS